MKKNVLALSIATMVGGLGFAGAASAALAVAESGQGHILTIPYYTAQNGNMTVFHLTNSDTVRGKAVKVRFRGASNSDDVLDFQVFMSPGDVWTAAVSKGADGKAQLVTGDKTCTLPTALQEGKAVPFITTRLTKAGWTDEDKANQTREGYIEILNMADITGAESYAADKTPLNFFSAIKHKNGVAPCTSSFLNDTLNWEVVAQSDVAATTFAAGQPWLVTTTAGAAVTGAFTGTHFAANAHASWKNPGLAAPTGTLSAQWYIMNVEQTTTYSGAATVINATPAAGTTLAVFSPQKNGNAVLTSADPLMLGTGSPITRQFYDVPDLSTPYEATSGTTATTTAAQQATALSAAIARRTVQNQFATAPGVQAKTDWVFSMPTRRYTIAANYATTATNLKAAAAGAATVAAPTPAATAYRIINGDVATIMTSDTTGAKGNIFATAGNTEVNDGGQICVKASSTVFWDREEGTESEGAVFSPGEPTKVQLCGEVSVLSFSSDKSAVGAELSRQNVSAPFINGWGVVDFGANIPHATAANNKSVPMLGNAFIKLSNPSAAPGVSGTYGITWPHTYTK